MDYESIKEVSIPDEVHLCHVVDGDNGKQTSEKNDDTTRDW